MLFTFNLIGIFKLKPILKDVNVFVLMQVMLWMLWRAIWLTPIMFFRVGIQPSSILALGFTSHAIATTVLLVCKISCITLSILVADVCLLNFGISLCLYMQGSWQCKFGRPAGSTAWSALKFTVFVSHKSRIKIHFAIFIVILFLFLACHSLELQHYNLWFPFRCWLRFSSIKRI